MSAGSGTGPAKLTGGRERSGLAALTVFSFSAAVSQRLDFLYLVPDALTVGRLLLVSLGVIFAVGPLTVAASAWRISRADTSLALRKEE